MTSSNSQLLKRKKMRMRLDANFAASALALALLLILLGAQNASAQHKHPCCGQITPAGQRLAEQLDSLNVESLWLVHEHINWETGEPDRGGDYDGPNKHTHCSAFAAASAKKFGVYLLRPPKHGQQLLANAQAGWLASSAGREKGWRPVGGDQEAQSLANRGDLVLAVFANPDSHEPGHIAVVRPSEKSAATLQRNGPQIIQAGNHNHASISVRVGFRSHAGAWPGGLKYYAHSL
jgi:hypothetical protein